MVRGLRIAIHPHRANPRRGVGRHEDEVAMQLRLAWSLFLVDLERRLMRLTRMRELPGVGERRRAVSERLKHARVQWIVGLEVEVSGDDRRERARPRVEW